MVAWLLPKAPIFKKKFQFFIFFILAFEANSIALFFRILSHYEKLSWKFYNTLNIYVLLAISQKNIKSQLNSKEIVFLKVTIQAANMSHTHRMLWIMQLDFFLKHKSNDLKNCNFFIGAMKSLLVGSQNTKLYNVMFQSLHNTREK